MSTPGDDNTGMKLFICFLAGSGFGVWRASFGAGLFMLCLFMVVWIISDNWRAR